MPLPIFGKQPKNPADVVRSLKEALVVLESKNPQSQSEGAGITSNDKSIQTNSYSCLNISVASYSLLIEFRGIRWSWSASKR